MFGAPQSVIESLRERARRMRAEEDSYEIEAVNAAAVRLFIALQSQWRVVVLSNWSRAEIRRVGLDYAAIEPTARLLGIEVGTPTDADPGDFARLRLMEHEALIVWSQEAVRR